MSLLIRDLSKSFLQSGQKIQVLDKLELQLKSGEQAAILGQSGSGKSTFLALVGGLDRPDTGQIFIGDTDISGLDEKALTKFRGLNMGIVFQQYHLIQHLTCLENVLLPLEILGLDKLNTKAKDLLSNLGLGHRMNHRPSQLSGGECQRVAIARALITGPKLLLADEPSGNLDVETGHRVMEVFFNIAKSHKTTTVLVTHSLELAALSQRRFKLGAGTLTEIK